VPVIEELDLVFRRSKFDRYQDVDKRLNYLWAFLELSTVVEVSDAVTDCRDVSDNRFLELVLSGKADFLITGDADQLSLHARRGIAILSSGDFLALSE